MCYNSIRLPINCANYLDISHEFNIIECYPTKEIEADSFGNFLNAPVLDNRKSYRRFEQNVIQIPESIYLKLRYDKTHVNVFIDKNANPEIYEAALNMRESKSSTKRVHKYMTLFKAYESISSKYQRCSDFVAIRHFLSHSKVNLTQKSTIEKLKELFGNVEIDFSRRKHVKVFYQNYWNLLIETDNILNTLILNKLKDCNDNDKDYVLIK